MTWLTNLMPLLCTCRCPFCNALTPQAGKPGAAAAALKINFAMVELLQFTDAMAAELAASQAAATLSKPASAVGTSTKYAGPGSACQNCGTLPFDHRRDT